MTSILGVTTIEEILRILDIPPVLDAELAIEIDDGAATASPPAMSIRLDSDPGWVPWLERHVRIVFDEATGP